MKVTNNSARLYALGSVQLAPGETKEVDEAYRASVENDPELSAEAVEVAAKPKGKPAPVVIAPPAPPADFVVL